MPPRYYGWKTFLGGRSYRAALEWQKRMVRYRYSGSIRDTLFSFEHPDVFTLGRDCGEVDPKDLAGLEFHRVSRGGGATYHGPGQLVMYPIFDLGRRGKDLRGFIRNLEEGIINACAGYSLACTRDPEHTGVWIEGRKLASIGVAVTQWISYHGAAINLTTDLKKFQKISPCGLKPELMTSLKQETGRDVPLPEFADRLAEAYGVIFDTMFQDISLDELGELVQLEESTQSL